MAKRVTTIPATLNRYSQEPVNSKKKRRVAGYGRVSTDSDEQATSYEAQVDYYTKYIQNKEDWEFVGMYTDEGITATNTKKRNGFKEMVDDALAGKIDLIITKSISRFARNTVDSLVTVRTLKEKGVEIYFEKENIWTLDSKGELLITIMSSIAQEESRSISENTTWGKRKAFSDGKASVAFTNFLGYDKGENGEFVVNPEQAKIVKLIYKMFLEGYSPYKIGIKLEEMQILTPMRKTKWYQSTVLSILTNEKYKGDALLQKQFTEDLVAEANDEIVGAVWCRIMNDYGHIDAETPSFAISLLKQYRNYGIGTNLMEQILKKLKMQGYKQASLSVQKMNYAVHMYLKVGFEIVDENDEEYIMICKL